MTAEMTQYIIERSCLNKANLTEESANNIIDRVLQNEQKLLYYYKCSFCNSFHLTSKEPTGNTKLEII